jgi:hypothetical protein
MSDARRRNLVREQQRLLRLGTAYRVCALCGFAHPAALLPVRQDHVEARVLEQHHPLGRKAYPDDVVILCRNCHALATEMERLPGLLSRAPSEDTLTELLTRAMAWYNLVRAVIAMAPKILALLERGFAALAASNKIPVALKGYLEKLLDALRDLVRDEPPAAARVRDAIDEVYAALAACDPTRHRELLELLCALGVQAEAGSDASP